jgi:hypothetical protein
MTRGIKWAQIDSSTTPCKAATIILESVSILIAHWQTDNVKLLKCYTRDSWQWLNYDHYNRYIRSPLTGWHLLFKPLSIQMATMRFNEHAEYSEEYSERTIVQRTTWSGQVERGKRKELSRPNKDAILQCAKGIGSENVSLSLCAAYFISLSLFVCIFLPLRATELRVRYSGSLSRTRDVDKTVPLLCHPGRCQWERKSVSSTLSLAFC